LWLAIIALDHRLRIALTRESKALPNINQSIISPAALPRPIRIIHGKPPTNVKRLISTESASMLIDNAGFCELRCPGIGRLGLAQMIQQGPQAQRIAIGPKATDLTQADWG